MNAPYYFSILPAGERFFACWWKDFCALLKGWYPPAIVSIHFGSLRDSAEEYGKESVTLLWITLCITECTPEPTPCAHGNVPLYHLENQNCVHWRNISLVSIETSCCVVCDSLWLKPDTWIRYEVLASLPTSKCTAYYEYTPNPVWIRAVMCL